MVRTQLDDLLAATRRGVILRDGLHVVIVGRPNAGKSSLLNALAQSERAIVTAVPGTTRDVLRESVNLDGIALTLVDTAGLRESADIVEREGMRRARAELAGADVAILVTQSGGGAADHVLLADCASSERAKSPARNCAWPSTPSASLPANTVATTCWARSFPRSASASRRCKARPHD
jgi:tRNA U34 5-carboxymethylaminomethyl modifying GTPase MnmE/TrmE